MLLARGGSVRGVQFGCGGTTGPAVIATALRDALMFAQGGKPPAKCSEALALA